MIVDSRGVLWGACWGKGVYTLDDRKTDNAADDVFARLDPSSQVLKPFTGTTDFVVCPAITEGPDGTIWVAGYDQGVYALDGTIPLEEGRSRQFTFEETGINNLIMMAEADPDGWIWLGTWETGLIGLKTGADPYTGSKPIVRISGGGATGELLGSRVYAVGVDSQGDVWVGTNGGLNRIAKRTGDMFTVYDESELVGSQAVEVYSIEIGPDDTKWIGTSAGLFRVNGENRRIASYTVDNSGLLSNMILSLRYDASERTLFAGTDAGLNGFDTGGGGGGSGSQAFVYPNPFEIWGTDSHATFGGLSSNKLLSIYTFNGELVIELTPEGSPSGGYEAVWDGRNYRGETVGTGIFFFTGEDLLGHPFRKKMAVVRR
jgi:streptogramin lyase